MVTLEQFYGLLKEAARVCPDLGSRCTQIQTFRALAFHGGTEINTDNLGATMNDRDKPYFWSRIWETNNFSANGLGFRWPALVVFERNALREHPFGPRPKVKRWLEIAVIDALSDGVQEGKYLVGCDGRTIHDIFRDTEMLLSWALKYISGSVVALVETLDGKTVSTLANEKSLVKALQSNLIQGYQSGHNFGATLGGVETAEQFRVDFASKKVFGTAVVVSAPFFDCPTDCQVNELPIHTATSCCT